MKKIHFLTLFACASLIFSCKKDREQEPENSYSNAVDFYQNNKEKEQEFIITSDSGSCIIAKKGTEICGSRKFLRTTSNDTVSLPYSIKIIELYSPKDHILYNFPTTANGTALKNDGSLRIKACKNGQETTLTATGAFTAKYSLHTSKSGNSAFKGTMMGELFGDWATATDGSSISKSGTRDSLRLGSFGWFEASQNSYPSSKTTIDFELDGTGGETLDLWLVQSSNKTILHGTQLNVQNVPIGEEMTAIVIAIDQNNKLVLHKTTFTVSDNYTITIDFKETSENNLLNTLSGL